MPNEPVQVILNPQALRAPRDPARIIGNGTDFFASQSRAFAAHRQALIDSLRGIQEALETDPEFDGLGYVRVIMRPAAIAKSHRPVQKLFRGVVAPHVATGRVGEPIYAVTPASIETIIEAVLKAETVVVDKLDKQSGQMKPNPSRNRCEVSAVSSIQVWTNDDKRDFSAAEGAAWLARAGTGGRYLIELFPAVTATANPELITAEAAAVRSLQETARALGALETRNETRSPLLALRPQQAAITSGTDPRLSSEPDAEFHQRVLTAISRNPLVRAIRLPPIVRTADSGPAALGSAVPADTFVRASDSPASIVGVIDGGVAPTIGEWVEGSWGNLAAADKDLSHGTFISGLLVAAGRLNPFLATQTHGCRVVDVDVLPADPGGTSVLFNTYYPNGVPDFMDEIETAVKDLSVSHGVRVFNFSMNVVTPGDGAGYGYTARRLDEIAEENNVIFIISAGNIPAAYQRAEWSGNPATALASLIPDTDGLLSEPAESLFNASVSALNPPGIDGQVPFALARYSRRGPGLRGATKPDYAHVGGSGTPNPSAGLFSVDINGALTAGAGTSYAAPLVARRLADLDSLIDGDVSREVLLAMLSHHAHTPDVFKHKDILPVTRDLIGFGVPQDAESMLQRDDSEITLVVDSVIRPGEQATLRFAWPASLVDNGKCRGYARLTLVARPKLAYEHGDERVRVNIGAKLMQEQKDGGFENRLRPVNTPPTRKGEPKAERELMNETLKWQVTKSFDRKLTGLGPSSNWKLVVNYLTRADESMPDEGVAFAAVLTIKDPRGNAPVFQQMRQELGRQGLRTDDIRTSLQVRPRA